MSGHSDITSSLDREDIPENGSLLFINVTSGCNIESEDTKAMKNPHFRYRVLYIEEEAKSSLFRAKTPIYTSKYVAVGGDNATDPSFSDQPFKFEMLYPEGMQEFRGEIAISLYSADINPSSQDGNGGGSGGNSAANAAAVFFGQVTFPISSIVKSGNIAVTKHLEGLSGRVVQGNFQLLSQAGKTLCSDPSINVNLQLFWWDLGDVEDQDNTALEDQDANPSANNSKRGGGIGGDGASSIRKRPGSSVGNKTKPSGASSKGGTYQTSTSKIVSSNQKKKLEVNFRIERDNMAMMKRLEKLSGKKDETYIDATKNLNKAVFAEEDYVEVLLAKSGKTTKKLISSLTDAEAMDIVNKLKPDVNELKLENDNLKGLVNQQKSILRKYESTLSKSTDFDVANHQPSLATRELRVSASGNDKQFYSRSQIFKRYGLNEAKIVDKEILDLVQEHEILQTMRKTLVENIKSAKTNEVKANEKCAVSMEKVKSFLRRLNLLYPHQSFVSDLLGGGDDIKISNASEVTLVENISTLRSEMAIMESFEKEELFCTELLNSIAELHSIIASLERTRDDVKKELQNQQFERDSADERFSRIVDNNYISKMRDMLITIRSVRSEYRKKRELNDVKTAIDSAELKLVQLNLSKQERKFKLKESLYNKSDLI